MAKKIWCLSLILVMPLMAQISPTPARDTEPTELLDIPTAGLLTRGSFDVDLRLFRQGGLIAKVDVGLTPRLMIGLGYGGENIIGGGKVNWNPQVGVWIKYRLFEESNALPALCLGYTNQGYGTYLDSTNRYQNKSKGVYAVMSKNYALFGTVSFHAGINYSFERNDKNDKPTLFFGFDKTINPEITVMTDYDLAVNDNNNRPGQGRGYWNAGIRWTFARQLNLTFMMRDLFSNAKNFPAPTREIKINYVEFF